MRAPTSAERAAMFAGGFIFGRLLCRWLEARGRRARTAALADEYAAQVVAAEDEVAWQVYIGDQNTEKWQTGIEIVEELRRIYGAHNPDAN